MPKTIDYPAASYAKAKELADAVKSLGGDCTIETCAHQLGKKVSGGFSYIIGAAVKFDLIISKQGNLTNTEKYKNISLAYDDQERKPLEIEAFLNPPVFRGVYERFAKEDIEVPVKILDKILIKEFNVDESKALTVGKYFINGAKALGLLDADNKLSKQNNLLGDKYPLEAQSADQVEEDPGTTNNDNTEGKTMKGVNSLKVGEKPDNNKEYVVHVYGPGLDSQVVIREEEDLDIVEVILKKVKRKLDQVETD